MNQWTAKFVEYPNPAANCWQTSIQISEGVGCMYFHVDGGFKLDRYHKGAKLYTNESEIRDKLLRKLLAKARKDARIIKAAIDANIND